MSAQKLVSDYFASPRQPVAGSSRQLAPLQSEAITLSSGSDDELELPVASTSKAVIPAKRTAAIFNETLPNKKAKSIEPGNRVERFRFSPSKQPAQGDRSSSLPTADLGTWTQKPPENAVLHKAFVAKLKGPKSKATAANGDQEEETKPSLTDKYARKSAKGKGKETAVKYTPLEEQVLKLKADNPGVLLLFQVGYKFKFYGEDAENASKVLGIACFYDRTFKSAMVPEQRVDVHVRRLVTEGFKVGVVRQMETAALKKVGDNRSAPFTRKLTELYTQATRVEELDHTNAPTSSTTVLAVVERLIGGAGADERVRIGLVSVQPSTSDIVYDEFEDGFMRSELETRLLHLEPGEIIMADEDVSKQTERMVNYLLSQEAEGIKGRLERLPGRNFRKYEKALSHVNGFYTEKTPRAADNGAIDIDGAGDADTEERLSRVANMSKLPVIALSTLIDHLQQYGLEAVFKRGPMHHFEDRLSMKLNGNTLQNLEIFVNQTDFTERGSLLWIIDHTKSRMGRRLLRKWLARPLTEINAVNARLDAVDEILKSKSYLVGKLRGILMGLPDLERGLCRIHYKKASAQELIRVLQAFVRVGESFNVDEGKEAFTSPALALTLAALQPAREAAEGRLTLINTIAAREGKLADMFPDPEAFAELQDCRDCLGAVLWELDEELKAAAKILKKPALEYITVAQEEFLVEVRKSDATKLVPNNWTRINGTKAVYRYRSPKMMSLLDERDQCQERLDAAAKATFLDFLGQVSEDSSAYLEAISRLSTLDCLFSFAAVAEKPGYCRPIFVDRSTIDVKGLRHPMIEELRPDPYVPNDITFDEAGLRTMCLSGANMGGKSSFARAVALAAIMAQIGCYVAAESFTAGLCDGVFTRMGASDELARGRSTFMVELSETSTILKTATSRSLIVFDELGRGTSTYDGLAIASAVLDHVVRNIDPLCIFISHFPALGKGIADSCGLYHMAYEEEARITGIPDVVFLHKLAPGPAGSSHGLNVARMAGLPPGLLSRARDEAMQLRDAVESRTAAARAARIVKSLLASEEDADAKANAVDAARQIVELEGEV